MGGARLDCGTTSELPYSVNVTLNLLGTDFPLTTCARNTM